jgi:hypothetical protein
MTRIPPDNAETAFNILQCANAIIGRHSNGREKKSDRLHDTSQQRHYLHIKPVDGLTLIDREQIFIRRAIISPVYIERRLRQSARHLAPMRTTFGVADVGKRSSL